jgi:predicted component of type VI protein secretion system
MDDPISTMQDQAKRAERYRKVTEEYAELADAASSPFLRAFYRRFADEYRTHADRELRVVERDGAAVRERTA